MFEFAGFEHFDWLNGLRHGAELGEHWIDFASPSTDRPTECSGSEALAKSSQHAWPMPPGEAAFYGLAGEFTSAVAPHTESDPVALLIQFIVAFGSVVGRSVRRLVESTEHHLNLFAVLVGETSRSRKGGSWSWVIRLFEMIDPVWADLRVSTGLSSGEGLVWAVRDGIETDGGVTDKRLLVVEQEFSRVLKVAKRHHNTLSACVRQAWDGDTLRIITKNDPTRAKGAHVSIMGHSTRDELLRELTAVEIANGFANRFLVVAVRRAAVLPFGGTLSVKDLEPLARKVRKAVAFAVKSHDLEFDESAQHLWIQIYTDLSAGSPGLAGAVLSRSEAQTLRLACVYAILDSSKLIRIEHLRAALALWDYCDRSVRFIFGGRVGDPIADRILNALESSPNGLTRTEISNLFKRNVSAEQIGRALLSLSAQNLARELRQPSGGRETERWFAIAMQ